MKTSNIKFKIGNLEVQGIWAIVLGIVILIPVLSILGVVLSIVFSIVGVVLTVAVGVVLIGIVLALIASVIPDKWRKKLGIRINWDKKSSKKSSTTDGKTVVDVEFKEEK